MADSPDVSFNLKHRVVGATALILVAVIFLPRVLTGTDSSSPRPHVDRLLDVPQIQPEIFSRIGTTGSDKESGSTRTRIEILDQPSVARTDKKAGSSQSTESPEAHVEQDRTARLIPLTGQSVSDRIVTGWIAQVGIFREPENAGKLLINLKNDGIDARSEVIEIDGQQATRIWLGPFSSRSEATREGNKAMMRTNSNPVVKEWP